MVAFSQRLDLGPYMTPGMERLDHFDDACGGSSQYTSVHSLPTEATWQDSVPPLSAARLQAAYSQGRSNMERRMPLQCMHRRQGQRPFSTWYTWQQ